MSDICQMAGHLIRRLNQISVSVFSERMAREGFDFTPVQFAALSKVAENPGMDQATLAGMIAYDRVTLGGVVDRLEHKGLVQRITSEKDRRSRQLHLTEDGIRILALLKPMVTDLQSDILVGLNREEQEYFIALLVKATSAANSLSRAPLRNLKA